MSFFKTAAKLHTLDKINEAEKNLASNRKIISEKQDSIDELEAKLRKHRATIDTSIPAPSMNEFALRERVQQLEDIEDLLRQPMDVIAKRNSDFYHTYMKHHAELAERIVSHSALKELIIKYGNILGKTPEDIWGEAEKEKEVVTRGLSRLGNNVSSEILDALKYKNGLSEKQRLMKEKSDEIVANLKAKRLAKQGLDI